MPKPILLLYVPALHASYIKLFEKYKDQIDALYILGPDILAQFPILQREIRAMTPEVAAKLIEGLGYFSLVKVVGAADLAQLQNRQVITTNEAMFATLASTYFPTAGHIQDSTFFLRFDENVAKENYGEGHYDAQVTKAVLHKKFMKIADNKASQSSNWWRRVGAALAINNQVVLATCNENMPTQHEQWMVGDPRTYLTYGVDTHRRNVIHAEQALIAEAAKRGLKTDGASLYATTFPCPDCSQVVVSAGIKKVYFQTGYADLKVDDIFKAFNVEVIRVV